MQSIDSSERADTLLSNVPEWGSNQVPPYYEPKVHTTMAARSAFRLVSVRRIFGDSFEFMFLSFSFRPCKNRFKSKGMQTSVVWKRGGENETKNNTKKILP